MYNNFIIYNFTIIYKFHYLLFTYTFKKNVLFIY